MNDLTTQQASPGFDTSGLPVALAALFDETVFARLEHVAGHLSKAKGFTPPHLFGNAHACFAVVTRSMTWRLDPFAVAQSTYDVGGKIAYEGKLVQAILENSGQVEGQIKFDLFGDWSKIQGKWKKIKGERNGKKYEFAAQNWSDEDEEGLGVTVSCQVKGESGRRELNFLLREAFPRNSVLWATRPSQQIKYTAVRAFASTVAPSLFMGVPFDTDQSAGMKDITEAATIVETGAAIVSEALDWYGEGQSAYGNGVKYRDAPGHLAATDYDDWCRGWQDASKEEHNGDSTEEGEQRDPEPSTADAGPDDDDTTRKDSAAEQSESSGPRSIAEMVADCDGNEAHEKRVRFAHVEALKGNKALEEWLKEQTEANITVLKPFGPDLRAWADAADNDGELAL